MCHDIASRPPAVPRAGTVAEHGALELTSSDGATFSAHQAKPAQPNGAKIVILPDVRGVHPYYQDLAQRFAEAGYAAVAVDYYGRTAGPGPRDDSFDWRSHRPSVDPAGVALDVAAAVEHLHHESTGPVFTVGFCFGGSQSWLLAASNLDLAGVIGFYGQPRLVEEVIGEINKPMLLLVAGADGVTTPEQSHTFVSKLQAAGVQYTMHIYDGAPHSFFDRGFTEWQSACTDAWNRILDFTHQHSAAPSA